MDIKEVKQFHESEQKTYIGMSGEGERVFITYQLTEGGKFSACGEYWQPSGIDINSCGQILDTILKEFPKSKLAQRIHAVWSKYHLNDMTAGTPKQEAAIAEFGDEILKRQATWDETISKYNELKANLIKKIDTKKWNKHMDSNRIFDEVRADILKRADWLNNPDQKGHLSWALLRDGIKRGSGIFEGAQSLFINRDHGKFLLQVFTMMDKFKRPQQDYTTQCSMLEEIGLLYDHSEMTTTEEIDEITGTTITVKKAYKYGSKWLKVDLPADIVKEIMQWVEVSAPNEPTPIEQFVIDNKIEVVELHQHKDVDKQRATDWGLDLVADTKEAFTRHKSTLHYIHFPIYDMAFTYFTGSAIDTSDQVELCCSAVGCLMSDAAIIAENDDPLEYLITEMGCEYNEAKPILDACQKTHDSLAGHGLYDAALSN